MSKGDAVPPVPADAPKVGEIYQHYKGDQYKVVGLALDSTDEWVVVYQPMYDGAVATLFTRPVREWHELVDLPAQVGWQGARIARFRLVG